MKKVLYKIGMHGCALLSGDLADDILRALADRMLQEPAAASDRGPGRYCTNHLANADLGEYITFMKSQQLRHAIDYVTAYSLGYNYVDWSHMGPHVDWRFGRIGGDVVLPRTMPWQDLHSDWGSYRVSCMMQGWVLFVSVAVHAVTMA